MNWNPQIESFISEHLNDDLDRLLFSAHRFPEVDMPAVVDQIAARRQLRYKLPEWYANPHLMMGGRVPAEQCSSESMANYKRQLVVGDRLCDLTGGMGVDLYYMSKGLSQALYVERQPVLCDAARHNFSVLGAGHIEVHEGDGRLLPLPDVDTFYLDPARRAGDGSRVYDLADCEPNVVEWQSELLQHCRRLIIKISPMADLNRVLQLMPGVVQMHVLAVRGECKEVLLVIEAGGSASGVEMFCVDYKSSETLSFQFMLHEEQQARSVYAERMGRYLYEPDVTLMKAGAFKIVGQRFGVDKLEVNSHLFTSDECRKDFPGRIFEVEEHWPFSSKLAKVLKKTLPQANITARNFPLTADQLRLRLGVRDGGAIYLFATTMRNVGHCLVRCHKCLLVLWICCLLWPVLSLSARPADKPAETIESYLGSICETAPVNWYSGQPFVYLNQQVNMLLVPEIPVVADTTDYRGSLWYYDAMVSEENWLGQKTTSLRFLTSDGRAYRFDTDRPIAMATDTAYHPIIAGLYPMDMIRKTDSLLRARTLYILMNDENVIYQDSVATDVLTEKFVPVVVDSVSYGSELQPVRIYYSYGDRQASVCVALPSSRESALTLPIKRCFSLTNPRDKYPEITDDHWLAIRQGRAMLDMTSQELRLALGKPDSVERTVTYSGVVERWHYRNGRIAELWDGRLRRLGYE